MQIKWCLEPEKKSPCKSSKKNKIKYVKWKKTLNIYKNLKILNSQQYVTNKKTPSGCKSNLHFFSMLFPNTSSWILSQKKVTTLFSSKLKLHRFGGIEKKGEKEFSNLLDVQDLLRSSCLLKGKRSVPLWWGELPSVAWRWTTFYEGVHNWVQNCIVSLFFIIIV